MRTSSTQRNSSENRNGKTRTPKRQHFARRVARQVWAAERKEVQAVRTPEEQLARLDRQGHRAVKERARLEAMINGRS